MQIPKKDLLFKQFRKTTHHLSCLRTKTPSLLTSRASLFSHSQKNYLVFFFLKKKIINKEIKVKKKASWFIKSNPWYLQFISPIVLFHYSSCLFFFFNVSGSDGTNTKVWLQFRLMQKKPYVFGQMCFFQVLRELLESAFEFFRAHLHFR